MKTVRRTRRNPKIGYYPDLFEPGETPVVRRLEESRPDQVGQLQLSDFTAAELAGFRRAHFSDEEWADLPEEIVEYIHENDPESKARIAKLVGVVVERYNYAVDPPADEAIESVQDYFDQWLRENDEQLIEMGGGAAQDLIEEFVGEGWAHEDVEGALTQAMLDEGNYVFDTTHDDYSRSFFHAQASGGGVYLDRSELDELLEGMFEDEIEVALQEINYAAWEGFIRRKALDSKYGIEKDVESDVYVEADPDWDRLKEAVSESLAGVERKGPAESTPISERVVYTFKDGAYVVDLLPSELAAEGNTQGICVGKPQYGYAAAVRQGKTKILSLRTQAGRPKFTIEVELTSGGEVRTVRQIKGKANRTPSKPEEVKKLVELMEFLGVHPGSVADLQAGLRALHFPELVRGNPRHNDWHCDFCRRPR